MCPVHAWQPAVGDVVTPLPSFCACLGALLRRPMFELGRANAFAALIDWRECSQPGALSGWVHTMLCMVCPGGVHCPYGGWADPRWGEGWAPHQVCTDHI